MRKAYKNLFGKHDESKHLRDLGIDDSIILKRCVGMGWIQLVQVGPIGQ
jgi:hypothetical protein